MHRRLSAISSVSVILAPEGLHSSFPHCLQLFPALLTVGWCEAEVEDFGSSFASTCDINFSDVALEVPGLFMGEALPGYSDQWYVSSYLDLSLVDSIFITYHFLVTACCFGVFLRIGDMVGH